MRVNRNHGGDNLNFVDEAFREQRANRAVNQTRDQGFAFAWAAFTTEEATRDTTSSVGTLLIVNGQWEEVLTWFGFFWPTTVTNTAVSSMLTITAAVA
ncbi:hypothetical protein EC182770_3106 [Escherichia coli 1827-70]|nr:hypothetical protein EC182770_3106 [Escherichia coli 1827-70]EHW69752.1 hypothetical protein ECDEC10C_4722 [Escherichia coli DEC10C]